MSKIIAAHLAAGYVPPQSREACRHCRHQALAEENGLGQVLYQTCRKHGFEVRGGGICNDYMPAYASSPKRDSRQLGLELEGA